ncbi:hypothetical protein PAXRUDRAFT_163495, partial [Paxillus rubicundulus Ve08.2h10]
SSPLQFRKELALSHNTMNMADTKSSKGLAATSIGTVDCARHNFKLPCSVGDLQKGERYNNMDYLFLSSLSKTAMPVLNVSYDIVCQWHKALWHQMQKSPTSLHLDYKSMEVTFLVPKFHLPTHIAQCQWLFSFNVIRGVGHTDGEPNPFEVKTDCTLSVSLFWWAD